MLCASGICLVTTQTIGMKVFLHDCTYFTPFFGFDFLSAMNSHNSANAFTEVGSIKGLRYDCQEPNVVLEILCCSEKIFKM